MNRKLRIQPFSEDRQAVWDDFVRDSVNGTLFHTRRFLRYHPPSRFEDASFLILDGEKLVSVVPAALIRSEDGAAMLVSHPGASYGGPVFRRKASFSLILSVVDAIERFARDHGAAAFQTRLPPHVFHHVPLEELEFALRFRGFRIVRSEMSSATPLGPNVVANFSVNCRNQLRQAQRGPLVAAESHDFRQFWDVLEMNLSTAHGVTPTHSLADILRLRELCRAEIRLFVACSGERISAGTVLFDCNSEAVHTFYMASRTEDRHLRPLNLAVHAAMKWAWDAGRKRINFGVSTPDGMSVNHGLLHFKEGFGGRGVCRDTYRKELC